jgi:uncharacterized protein (TIGR02466 family)
MLWDSGTTSENVALVAKLVRKAQPDHPEVVRNWEMLAGNLLKEGKPDQAADTLTEAVATHPSDSRLRILLVHALHRCGRLDAIEEHADRIPPVPSHDQKTKLFELENLSMVLDAKRLTPLAREVLSFAPTNVQALRIIGKTIRENGNIEEIVAICRAALRVEPGHTYATYELALALTSLGDLEEAKKLIDLQRFVWIANVDTPMGFQNAAEFEATLASEIAADPTLRPDPIGKATRNGLQTTSGLPHGESPALTILLNQIRQQVASIVNNLDHSFLANRPRRVRLDAWAVVYPGTGHQVSHIHSGGWLSGVYYVSAPKSVASEDPDCGCLILGTIEGLMTMAAPPWGTRRIEPAPGRLVLFPSYVPHATQPTNSAERRICVAFDLVRVAP